MTIQRQFSLPNCKLVIEGWGDDAAAAGTGRPLISMLVNAECHFTGHEKHLSGGQEFLESLSATVSNYAQELLSGVSHTIGRHSKQSLVQIRHVGEDHHQLTLSAAESAGGQPMQIDLRTVQLFDLVEAVDQLIADSQTLPQMTLDLTPVSKRHVVASEPIVQRAMPAALGVSSLAVAAIALFFLPVPEVRRPEPTSRSTADETAEVSPTTAPPNPTGTPNPPEAEADSDSPAALTDSTETPDGAISEATSAAPPSAADLEAVLSNSSDITDPAQLRRLMLDLRNQLDASWDNDLNSDEPLIFQVGVAADGDILGFRYMNDAAVAHVNDTPLVDLQYTPTDAATTAQEPVAQYRVVFRPNGALEVSPWNGFPPEAEPSPGE